MKKLAITLIKFYQNYISAYSVARCRYQPTCSNYMQIAIERFGFFLGLIMGAARILRCNPLVKGGYDFVPNHFSIHRNQSK